MMDSICFFIFASMKFLLLILLLPGLLFAELYGYHPREDLDDEDADSVAYRTSTVAYETPAEDSVDMVRTHPTISYSYIPGICEWWELDYSKSDDAKAMPYLLNDKNSRSYARAGRAVGWTGTGLIIASFPVLLSNFAFWNYSNPEKGDKATATSKGVVISGVVMFVTGYALTMFVSKVLMSSATDRYNGER